MNTLQIPFSNFYLRYTFPSKWEELSLKMLLGIRPLLHKLYYTINSYEQEDDPEQKLLKEVTLNEQRIYILLILLDLPWYKWLHKKWILTVYPDEMKLILDAMNFIFEKPNLSVLPDLQFKLKGKKVAGPGERLNRLSGLEYHYAFHYLDRLKNKIVNDDEPLSREQLINCLCYCLYRPIDRNKANPEHHAYHDDKRIDFKQSIVEEQSTIYEDVDIRKKDLIVWWFDQQQAFLQSRYPKIFTQKKKSDQAGNSGWLPVFRALAKSTTEIEDVAEMNLGLILYDLNETLQEKQKLAKS